MRGQLQGFIGFMLLCGILLPATAQRSFRHLNKRDGLSQNSVFAITQDGQGFMWFGTRDGLNKYDGYRIITYRHQAGDSSSLVSNDIRHLYFDQQGDCLWIGTLNGLSRYRAATDAFTSYRADGQPGSLPGPSVRAILRDQKGRLWVGTDRGLCVQNSEGAFTALRGSEAVPGSISSNNIKVLYEDRKGQLWVGTEEGLHRLVEGPNGDFTFVRVLHNGPLRLRNQHIKAIAEDTSGQMWIGTHGAGLSCWSAQRDSIRHYSNRPSDPNSLSHNNIRALTVSPSGTVWVGTFVGLNRFLPGEQQFERLLSDASDAYSLSSSSVRSVFFDHRGSLWVGTYYGGTDFYDPESNRFGHLQHREGGQGLSHNVVSSFWEEPGGDLWIGTEGGGLNFFDRSKGRFTYYESGPREPVGISGNNVKTLHKNGPYLWIGFFSAGLDRFDPRSGTFLNFRHEPGDSTSLPADNVYSLLPEGDSMWVATYGGGLALMDMQTGGCRWFQHDPAREQSLCSNLARVLFRDRDGQYWIGTDDGLDRFAYEGRGQPPAFEHLLPGTEIYALYQSADGYLWAGTYSDGLFLLEKDGTVVANYTESNGLPGHTIFGILEGDGPFLWLSTNNGLAKLDRRDGSFTAYNYSDGLRNLEFNFNAYYRTRSGELLFGGTNGITRFRPEDIRLNSFVPPVVFTALKSFNEVVRVGGKQGLLQRPINFTDTLTFPYNRANFSISFAALDYLNPGNNRYAYTLEGLEDQWTYKKGQTEATYTLQRPGDYTFRLRAANNDGLWNPEERQILIQVLPPPWRTGWAYLAYFLLGTLIFLAIVRFLRLRHRLEMEELEHTQREKLHQAKLRFFTNIAHEFRTPLTLILGPLEALLKEDKLSGQGHRRLLSVEHNAKRLLYLVNQLLNFRKLEAEHEQLRAAEGNIARFLREIHLSFQEHARARGIHYHFSSSSSHLLLWYDRDKLEKVFFNLLSNAFKFTPDGGQIFLKVEERASSIVVSVSDTGRGVPQALQEQIFKRFFEKEASFQHSFKGTGIGLSVSRQLVEMHHGSITVESAEGEGATFYVELPKGKKHFRQEEIIPAFKDSEDISHYQPPIALPEPGRMAPPPEEQLPEADEDAPLLLIVEDNEEVLAFIREAFAGRYRLLTATNGVQGLDLAIRHSPDIIVSDVMMPKMDGITLCSRLKTHLHTSHIPVVLLTARTNLIFKLEGLETGADDYITKPFSPKELRLRVHNLLHTRRQLREKFGRVQRLEPKEVAITSADERFLEQALQTVEQHMDNPDFSVEDFARALAVSRALLFTKIKSLTDLTPNKFVKSIRLKRAAQLLEQQKLTISEVAFRVGFRDPRYFSKCFQQAYGKNPKRFMEQTGQ